MIGRIVCQLFKLKNRRLIQKISRIHIIFQYPLRGIAPSLPINSVLPRTGKRRVNQALIAHFTGNSSIPIHPRIHPCKNPIGMFVFQGIKRILVRRRELVYIRMARRILHHHGNRRDIKISIFPIDKIFIRSRQIFLLYITGVFFCIPVQTHLIPDGSVFIRFHIRNLYRLSARHCTDCPTVARRNILHFILITQIDKS